MVGLRGGLGPAALALALGGLIAAGAPALANDRPFLITSGAVSEDDDDGEWAVETWWQRAGAERALTIAPEYSFNPFDSLQLLYTRIDERRTDGWSSTLELEFKHIFNNLARDGYGWGWHVSLDAAKAAGEGWRSDRAATRLLLTLPFRDGDALLHLNAGIGKSRDERREWIGSAAFEHRLPWWRGSSHAFFEIGREDRATLLHGGVRQWLKKEKFAVDVGVQQLRGAAGRRRDSGLVIGFGWYDL